MKIRNGFVSNSSSSSFCIYGITIDNTDDTRQQIMDYLVKNNIEVDSDDFYELAERIPGLEYHSIEGDAHYLGRSFASIKDDETGKQFKDGVKNKLTEIFGKGIKCEHLKEAFYS